MTTKWPVLHAGQVPDVDLATWTLPRLRRGRAGGRADVGAVQRAAAVELDAGHPLRHALEPLRRPVRGRPLERAREALQAAADARASRSPTPSTASRRTCRSTRSRATTRCSPPTPTASRSPPTTAGRSASSSRAVLLEERQVAARRSSSPQVDQPRLLGALRLPQRRRPLERGAVRLLAAATTSIPSK